jgi:hypothetical protein
MQIHVARQQQQLGVFAAEDIVAGLASGRFLASDLAWREGMPAWTPLGDWAEFRGAGLPAAPGEASAPVPPASLIPWEQGKSLGSFFATIKLAVVNPGTLSTGRYACGDWLVFCYLALAITLPSQIAQVLIAGDQNAAVRELLSRFNHPQIKAMAEQIANTPPTSTGLTVFSLIIGLAILPLFYALTGLFHWLGQKIFRLPPSVERTVAATLLACGTLVLLSAPLQLLAFNVVVQFLVMMVLFIPFSVIYYRAFGAATGVNPWVQFGVSCFVWFVLCCCCCIAPAALFAFLGMR